MKKLFGVLAGILSCLLISFSAKADVIWEPEDSFYRNHAEECTYVNRQYTANGPDNKVFVYKSPEFPQVIATWENGYRVYILYIYEDSDGILWGVYDDYRGSVGWMPMEYMELVYDSISFAEEHAEQIVEESGELEEKYVGETIYFWKYPGSEEYTAIKAEAYPPTYRGVYVDENGNRWGCAGYYFGIKNVWVCIDRPTADFEQIFPEGVPEADSAPAGQDTEVQNYGDAAKHGRIVPKLNRGLTATAAALVVLVVAVTVVLLKKLKNGRNDRGMAKQNRAEIFNAPSGNEEVSDDL